MSVISYLGFIGLILISLGWVSSIKNKPPATLSGLYSLGSLMLFIYAFVQRDLVFSALNLFAVAVSGYQFVAKVYEDKKALKKNDGGTP
ncbi:MAG: hypothetical protein ACP5LZ_05470 [Fervidicoccaceae archaeon]|jgi:lipid-A-disaccharide synthase-like uncharacterized protein